MAVNDEVQHVTRALTGLGVDEKSLIAVVGKWQHEERKSFRKGVHNFFVEDERSFERVDSDWVKRLKKEFLRFQHAFVMWTMHPYERDARLARKAMKKGPEMYSVLVEIACSRSSDELLGTRRAYHSLFDHSIEEDVAHYVKGPERKLLVALVSAYRYEGPKLKEDAAKSEAKALAHIIKSADNKKSLVDDDEVVRILSTRSKPHLKQLCEQYKKISDKNLDEDFGADLRLRETVQCLCVPHKYFAKLLDSALKSNADKNSKKEMSRVIVTRSDVDMKHIREEFKSQCGGVELSKKIEDSTNGSFKDLLLALVSKGH